MSEKKEDKNSTSGGSVLAPDIKKAGILRKLKTMKKKYFVLRTDSDSGPARLEYYDNEKKFKAGVTSKRSIAIKTCFNINRKVDAKHKLAIALYTKDDCFSVVADSEASLDEWLNAMLELQLDAPCQNGGAKLKPKFEHVWQVTVGDKSLASARNMKGIYRLCLTPSSLTLIKVDQTEHPEMLEFSLMSIRRCGHTNNYFVIELGRSSITGAGEIWLETEDVVIAQNMHEVTLNAMKTCREHEDLGPLARPRSASNSENSRPIATRRPIAVVSPQAVSYGGIRERCDSMPSRPRTISEGQEVNNRGYYAPQGYILDSLRPHSGFSRTVSYSPPAIPNPLSPVSATCSTTDSAGSSLSIDEFDAGQQTDFAHGRYCPTDGALHTEPPIKEEQPDEYVPMSVGRNNDGYLSMAPISSSVPNAPPVFLSLNSVESTHSSSLPPISQASDYMEMKSPTEGYINMSPIGASPELRANKSCSSLDTSNPDLNQTKDGYIPMAPLRNPYSSSFSTPVTQHEGYLDMVPLSSSLPKTFSGIANHNISISTRKDSTAKLSETSVSSPGSTNLEDFPLDKVKSLLADADDTSCDSYIRPVRAYSMGSRPQPKKSHLPLQLDGSRIRAYSVGSQAAQKRVNNPLDRELGNLMRIDPRTGAKSSSAPLLNNRPPRVRSSTSRGEVGEDLMEIDYNKVKYPSTGIDFCDSNFTIEPVGRSRSGSYSSSTNSAIKMLHDRDKAKSHSTGHSCSKDSSEYTSDYLSMSPLSDSGKTSKPIASVNSLKKEQPTNSKKVEHLHPPGDYVSLDPSRTYETMASVQACTLLRPGPAVSGIDCNTSPSNQGRQSPNTSSPATTSPVKQMEYNSQNHTTTEIKETLVNKSADDQLRFDKQINSDYMCMDYQKNVRNSNLISSDKIPANEHSYSSLNTDKAKKVEPIQLSEKSSNVPSASPFKDSTSSPISKSPSPRTSGNVALNYVPKTPPPSPSFGAISTPISGAPFMENLVRRLSQPSGTNITQPTNCSRPNSTCGEIRLNYASLDLPPASEEDNKCMPGRLRKSLEGETKEAPLTYAQIDFSPIKQKAFQESESLSHL
ncbi:insulin receptor substrate 2-B-like [Uloborus diversus]|uniref:insulin receptor substrate 2-B-like n=1 Tax=Uloborus diversus TaxID=327109 RepID=UPI002409BF11|nr:insulin receptor substrate 2-B-like [Uloborus diversus]